MTELERLQMLLGMALFALDMPPDAKEEEPWVRLATAAHKYGRKLEREEMVAHMRAYVKELYREGEESLAHHTDALATKYERREDKKVST